MAATLKKPSREKEEAGAGNMMLDVHPLHPSRPFPNRKPNRENRIKNACFSNSHSNIAASNDKRPLFVQIPATSSASLVSTSLPVQCLRPTNFFFFRRIFLNSFLNYQKTRSPVGKKSRRRLFDFIAIQTSNGSMRGKQRLLQHQTKQVLISRFCMTIRTFVPMTKESSKMEIQ